jgi:hypothetical protein
VLLSGGAFVQHVQAPGFCSIADVCVYTYVCLCVHTDYLLSGIQLASST